MAHEEGPGVRCGHLAAVPPAGRGRRAAARVTGLSVCVGAVLLGASPVAAQDRGPSEAEGQAEARVEAPVATQVEAPVAVEAVPPVPQDGDPAPAPRRRGHAGSVGDPQPFGYDVLGRMPVLNQTLGAVDPDYPLGPGDEVLISAWGQVEFAHQLTVDREGGISVPRVGRLQVAGVPLRELEDKVLRFLSSSYSTVAADTARSSTHVDVTLGRLRTIQVFVLGEVQQPGAYLVSATATVLNALGAAGGPLSAGSLRRVRHLRHDRIHAHIDFYRFLLEGDKNEEVRLQHGDVIVVPPVGTTVSLRGRVHRPARYELAGDEGLGDLFRIAGGLEADAYARRVQVQRIVANVERQIIDVDYARLAQGDSEFALQDGDRVTVSGIPDEYENAVTLRGVVRRPGAYQLEPGMRVADLLRRGEGALDDAYPGRARLVRTHADLRRQLIPFHLSRALAGDPEHNLVLQPLDEVEIYSIHTFRDAAWVHIDGLVRRPGRYELLEDMGLADLIATAGGLRDEAYRLAAEIARSHPAAAGAEPAVEVLTTPVSDRYEVGAAPAGEAPLPLQDGDHVFVRPNPDFEPQSYVDIGGEVRLPGRYALRSRHERLSQLVARAGGLRPRAYPEGVRFVRPGLGRVGVDLPRALAAAGGEADLVLRDGDEVLVPTQPVTVEVAGAVRRPVAVPYQSGAGPDHYLERAGGTLQGTDTGAIYLEMPNGELRVSRRILWLWRWWPEVRPGTRIVVPAPPG